MAEDQASSYPSSPSSRNASWSPSIVSLTSPNLASLRIATHIPSSHNPFNQSPISSNPFNQSPISSNPFNQSPISSNPFNQSPISSNPFNQSPISSNPRVIPYLIDHNVSNSFPKEARTLSSLSLDTSLYKNLRELLFSSPNPSNKPLEAYLFPQQNQTSPRMLNRAYLFPPRVLNSSPKHFAKHCSYHSPLAPSNSPSNNSFHVNDGEDRGRQEEDFLPYPLLRSCEGERKEEERAPCSREAEEPLDSDRMRGLLRSVSRSRYQRGESNGLLWSSR